jgi:protein involved in polysaccharide export with SLBB domain
MFSPMTSHRSRAFRAVAVVLCCQPIFWSSSVALAQTMEPSRSSAQQLPGSRAAQQPFTDGPALGFPGAQGSGAQGGGSFPGVQTPSPFGGTQGSSPFGGTFPGGNDAADVGRLQQVPGVSLGPTPIDAPLDPDAYVCGHGDVLDLDFWGVQNLRLRTVIDLEGRAFVPKVGFFDLGGKTLSEARRMLRASVARLYPRLEFAVSLAEPRTFLVHVADDVVRPGAYPARAVERVATLVARAGGFGPNASRRRVEIRRRDGTVLHADLLRYALTGDVKANPFLLDGDVVRVPFEELAVTVAGAVNRPGRYELVGKRDLAELVELAGGLAPGSTTQLPLSVVRLTADDRQEQKLLPFPAGGAIPLAELQHEDSVRVPSVAELQQSVMVIGAVAGVASSDDAAATRRLPFVQGDSVRTLLERVGGVGSIADLRGAYVLRSGQAVPVDLYTLVMLRDVRADKAVELGDTLVVPFKRRSILVQGAVFAPGTYPYNPTYGVEQYVSLAGGPSRFAQSLSNVRVISPDGETRRYRSGLEVEPGSSLVVPERNFSRAELVQIGVGIASVVVSGVAVIIAARK